MRKNHAKLTSHVELLTGLSLIGPHVMDNVVNGHFQLFKNNNSGFGNIELVSVYLVSKTWKFFLTSLDYFLDKYIEQNVQELDISFRFRIIM